MAVVQTRAHVMASYIPLGAATTPGTRPFTPSLASCGALSLTASSRASSLSTRLCAQFVLLTPVSKISAGPVDGRGMTNTRTFSAESQRRQRSSTGARLLVVDFTPSRKKRSPAPKVVKIAGRDFYPTVIFDTFFKFVSERHLTQQLRLAGKPPPWTSDSIIATYPFTNVFRVYDRVSQYVLRNVIQQGDQNLHEQCFRVMVFRSFNKIETWELLTAHFGAITWRDFDVNMYEDVLVEQQQNHALYGHAYIIPSPKLGGRANASNHLRLVQLMMEEDLPGQLRKLHHLKDAHGRISLFPGMGDFMALQLLLDLNMTPHFNYSEDEWVALGPGSLECLRKMFGPSIRGFEFDALRYLHQSQHTHFARLHIRPRDIPRVPGHTPGLSMVDLEHALCECEKYSRACHPSIKGKRQQVAKRLFVPRPNPITADVPPHWLTGPRRRREAITRPDAALVDSEGEEEYEVSHIVAEKRSGSERGDPQYLIRWRGWGPEDDTWEHESRLVDGAPDVLEEWKSLKARIAARAAEMQAMGVRFKGGTTKSYKSR
ncbi:hypothetical protein BN946_scf185008.g26 [Trametes cinnabarina]|uniref:Chromo domain-containing protein n=1 Tax=Pycnoporus cinnabarinus TaxID=5643 RepID=A0A060SM14_PYCCI|nr:hypothetical protein BN946_scf185008.g26 [Trametes cinnabarina]